MIIVKQLPHFLGQEFDGHEFWHILAEVPRRLGSMDSQTFTVLGLGAGCLTLLFVLGAVPARLLKIMPPPVWVFFIGTIVANQVLHLGVSEFKAAQSGTDRYLINVPNPLEHGIVLPEFKEVFGNSNLWFSELYMVFLLILIDGTESLATIMAVDKLDPFHRRSNPDRTLQAMGVSNFASSILGGLTIIPGIVKSTANIMGGGRTQWANFYNACFLLTFLLFARDLINMVPYVVLASILVYVGFKLCRPKVWVHVAHIGLEQLLIFTATVLITVTTDLLIGIATGVVMKLILNLWYVGLAYRLSEANGAQVPSRVQRATSLFRNPVGRREFSDGVYELYLNRPLVCFNLFHVIRELQQIPFDAKGVKLHFTKLVALVDHTTAETLFHYVADYNSRQLPMELVNWEQLRPLSAHPSAIQLGLSGELIESLPPEASEEPTAGAARS